MRYVDFRDSIRDELSGSPEGMTWKELKERLDLPYKTPCSTWVQKLEREIGLTRARGSGRAYVWTVPRGGGGRKASK